MKPIPEQRLYKTDEDGCAEIELGIVYGDKRTGFWFVPHDVGEGHRKGSKAFSPERSIPRRYKIGEYKERWKIAAPGAIERDQIERPIETRWKGGEGVVTHAEPVGTSRRPTSFVLVERGLFDAADGMPYVPNVEAKKDSA